jgi:hypothetical protein
MSIGYLGCSNSSVAVQGYHAVGGKQFWTPVGQAMQGISYAGGTIVSWSKGWLWPQFLAFEQAAPADKLWLQICLRSSETVDQGKTAAQAVVGTIRGHLPTRTVPIYVSALNGYVQEDCAITGPAGPRKCRAVRNWMVAQGLADLGPAMPTLSHDQLLSDRCHPNQAGADKLGRALLNFFG